MSTLDVEIPTEANPRMTGPVLRLAGPVVVERLSISVLSAVDAFLVGHYVGADAVAAVGLSILLFWIPLAGAFGIDIAATAVVARDFGAKQHDGMGRTMRASVLAAFVWGTLATALLWPLAPQLMTVMAAEPEVKAFGIDYIRAASLGLPLLMTQYAAAGVMRGLGNTTVPMAIAIVLNIINAIASVLLISGVIGIELEVLGSGIGFAIGSAVGGLLSLAALMYGFGPVRYRLSEALATGREEWRRLINIGLPSGLEEVQFMAAFIVYTRIVSGMGTASLAAHAIALRMLELAIVPGFSIGAAATTLVSRYLGAKRPDLAERAADICLNLAVGTMVVLGVPLFIFAPQFVSIFVNDQEVIGIGTDLLRIFVFAFPFMALHASLGGALRGAGDAPYVLGVMTVTAWLVRIPMALLLGIVAGYGAPGAWTGAAVENVVRGSIIFRRYRQGRWKEKVV